MPPRLIPYWVRVLESLATSSGTQQSLRLAESKSLYYQHFSLEDFAEAFVVGVDLERKEVEIDGVEVEDEDGGEDD